MGQKEWVIMAKYLRVEMSDGTMYDIPAEVIAEHRAGYFEDNSAEKLSYHSSSVQPRLHHAEKEFAMNNDEILVEWASKNMKWSELEPHAKKVEPETNNHEKEWPNAPKKIVTR